MSLSKQDVQKILSEDFITLAVRIGILTFVLFMCARYFAPFASLMLWGLILAVSLYPLYLRLLKKMGNRNGRTATAMILVGIIILGIPTAMIASSFAEHVHSIYTSVQNNTLEIKQPSPKVAEWPIVGEKIYTTWNNIADDLPGYINKNQEQLKNLTKGIVSGALNSMGGIMLFLVSLIIAGIMMAYGESGSAAFQKIYRRIAGPNKGPKLWTLTVGTIRSVANGVIGIAFIQALILGIGLILADIPAAGALAIVILFLGIAQLPALLITIPAIGYMWTLGDLSITMNVIMTLYLVVGGFSDGILKPLLLGRGVDAPMPVILIGAIGGMITAGIIGLFIGAVFLAVGYQIFMNWVDTENEPASQGEHEAK